MQELELAFLGTLKTAVAGHSGVCYRAMGWLLEDHEEKVRAFYNESIRLGHLPPCLKAANGIIIAKPDQKESEKPKNYRPLVIEDTLTKLLENIIA